MVAGARALVPLKVGCAVASGDWSCRAHSKSRTRGRERVPFWSRGAAGATSLRVLRHRRNNLRDLIPHHRGRRAGVHRDLHSAPEVELRAFGGKQAIEGRRLEAAASTDGGESKPETLQPRQEVMRIVAPRSRTDGRNSSRHRSGRPSDEEERRRWLQAVTR
jgi:hypothetical protein